MLNKSAYYYPCLTFCNLQLLITFTEYSYMREGRKNRGGGRKRHTHTHTRNRLLRVLHSPSPCNDQGWARPEPGAGNSVQISHRGRQEPKLWSGHLLFPVTCTSRKLGLSTKMELELRTLVWDGMWAFQPHCPNCETKCPSTLFFYRPDQ